MKITDVEAFNLRLPDIQARTDSSQDALLIRITTDAGIVGWGEVDGCPSVVKAIIDAPYSHTLVTGLKSLLIGENPLETRRLWDKMYRATLFYGRGGAVVQAMAGIDIALWDIKGKALGKPIVELLGGAIRSRMRVYSSNMFQFSVEDTVARAKHAVDTGHTGVKFGWEPFGQSEAMDLKYVEAIRRAIGDETDFMLDVGLIWDAKTTIRRSSLFEPYNLFWIEEPLHPDDYAGYGKVSAGCSQRIAAGEEECTVVGFERLIDEGGIDVVQIDLTRTGFTQAMRIADYAASRRRKVCNHNFTTDINTAASLHFLCALENALVMEYCVEPGELSKNLAVEPVKITDGFAQLPDAPGLGVEPRMDIIEKYLA
ncbi:mandelate racemase/muconate lactonizing enzyme family protein [Microvirga lotononidis]|uniref:Enolase superfamily enzyme related to L-alanine-DL-glutamate epimerase n=1 Tax=Microvirga lotononidis TaxID=864069 RepID=I4YUF5_9HYPH|nr:mandelate racemase/muconate lactonizing enzyme family protein [Microvirga lotononidis]EIM27597.1 enolase superfamily enzyme related to L-alanine-DL-glutamate epimerase [Microvirga lotononidis]WQO28257.1 mandelate racemase/muconate lactonizing enzyme family protein [Microvirga lotononidis]